MVENEKKSKKGKIKKIDGRLLLVLVARVVVNCGIWHIVVEVFFCHLPLLLVDCFGHHFSEQRLWTARFRITFHFAVGTTSEKSKTIVSIFIQNMSSTVLF